MSSKELVVRNARVVGPTDMIAGGVVVRDGRIADVFSGACQVSTAEDWEGDLLLPGLVELHTDNLEKHLLPRPGVWWPALPALSSHDAQLAAAGITTVLDAIALGDPTEAGPRTRMLTDTLEALDEAQRENILRIRHLLHLRCELGSSNVVGDLEAHIAHPALRLVSLMDHTPGQRQWIDLARYRQFYQGRNQWSDAKADQMIVLQQELQRRYAAPNRRKVAALAQERGVVLASHDDTTPADVSEAIADGVEVSEFPTTAEAARLARDAGMTIIMGGPNLVRGSSHSGNVSALELAELGLLDAISSDYMPASLLIGAFRLHRECNMALPAAVATVSRTPARMVKLEDRGSVEPGQLADLIRVTDRGPFPIVKATYRDGERVV
jgi:alpha-D-ribose 1-methylphosphonate 5-triphosphate diphosphatase